MFSFITSSLPNIHGWETSDIEEIMDWFKAYLWNQTEKLSIQSLSSDNATLNMYTSLLIK